MTPEIETKELVEWLKRLAGTEVLKGIQFMLLESAARLTELEKERELLLNAITEAVREVDKCPEDSIQDIWNESLKSWKTGLRMNHRLEVNAAMEETK